MPLENPECDPDRPHHPNTDDASKPFTAVVRIWQVQEPILDDFVVDPSRVMYGVRRFWWVVAICATAGALATLSSGTSQTVFDVELRESASRTRLVQRPNQEIALIGFPALVGVMNSTERQDAVEEFAGEAVNYTVSLTPTGLVAVRVVGPSEEKARELSSSVLEALNDWLADEQREVVTQRVAELTQSTEFLAAKIESIEFSTGDDVTAVIERSALIYTLVNDQSDLSELASVLEQPAPGSSLVRTSTSSSTQRSLLLGAVAGALLGLAIAAGMGLTRRRVRDATDLRRIADPLPVFVTTTNASPSETAALVTGVVAELGGKLRSHTWLTAVGESTGGLHSQMLHTSSHFGLGLASADGVDIAISDQMLTLVAADADWAAVLGAPAGSNVLLVVRNGDAVAAVAEQIRLFRTSRLPLVGCVLLS